ncbi:response regulator [Oceanobacillus damuensis]|uniref:response regulator n=1 Tax=Oceanobacillus damuensis TaxID=937928 RepID=UPI000834F4E1|nr:response regulator [Oceanobacillus damuensis]
MIQILIVEDDYRLADIHQKFLMELDYVHIVGKALTGKEAIEIASKKDIDLVLLDLYLPDMMGIEIIKELRNYQPDVDVIIISAASEKGVVGRAIRSGVFDYIIKPVIKERLIDTVARYNNIQSKLVEQNIIDQRVLDNYFGLSADHSIEPLKATPKGIDPLTLEKVKEIMEEIQQGITAEKMGKKIGASRTTARRYLEFLISQGKIVADLEYGTIGRPERIYHFNRNIN